MASPYSLNKQHICKYRQNNHERCKELCREHSKTYRNKVKAWKLITTDFRNILIDDFLF